MNLSCSSQIHDGGLSRVWNGVMTEIHCGTLMSEWKEGFGIRNSRPYPRNRAWNRGVTICPTKRKEKLQDTLSLCITRSHIEKPKPQLITQSLSRRHTHTLYRVTLFVSCSAWRHFRILACPYLGLPVTY